MHKKNISTVMSISEPVHSIINSVIQSPTISHIKQPIRTYVRIFPSNGVDPVSDNQYQIVDGNTFLNKKDCKKLIINKFNYIFNNDFYNCKQIQHMNIVEDCFQGKNQLVVAQIDKQYFQHFFIGSAQDPGFIISLFSELFNQTLFFKQKNISKTLNKQESISISLFSTQGDSNKFIDLILGQKLTFYSKKDMDQYKDFYDKQILDLKQFLILLKIACLHYKQCCKQGDPIVVRITVDSFDQVKNLHHSSIIHVAICESQSKVAHNIARKIQFTLKNGLARGQDHGSLANYFQLYFRKSKLIFIYGFPYRRQFMQSSACMFDFLSQLRNHQFLLCKSAVDLGPYAKIQALNNFCLQKPRFSFHNLSHRQINQASALMQKICDFLSETQLKWKNYFHLIHQILDCQQQFYSRQQFPISLQIQQFSIKSFIISKVYKLSETYQMDDQLHTMEKLRIIKNQVYISLKALNICKQYHQACFNNKLNNIVQYYNICIASISNNIKLMFSFTYRNINVYKIKLLSQINIQHVLDSKIIRMFINKLKNQSKIIQQKQQILIRKLDGELQLASYTEQIVAGSKSLQPTSRLMHPIQQANQLTSTQAFQMFKKHRKHKNLSNLVQLVNKIKKPSPSPFVTLDNRSSVPQQNKKKIDNQKMACEIENNISVLITRNSEQKNYNFSLPKIAIIHKKMRNR